VVAIDLGISAVRVVEANVSSDDARIIKRGSAKLPSQMWDDVSKHKDALVTAIKSAMSAAGLSGSPVHVSFPRRMATLKYARLPHADAAQISMMIQFEAQQYIPFPLDEVVLGHQIVSDPMDEQTVVMIVAAKLQMVEDLMSAFDKAGLEVASLTVSALALSEHGKDNTVPTAYLDIDSGEMDLTVVSAGRLLFSRAASTGVTIVKDGGAQRLALEVARSLSAYQNEYRVQPVSKLVLSGTPGDFSEIEKSFSELLDIPVERLSSSAFPAPDPDSLQYAVAVGGAIEGAGFGSNKVDLVPPSRRERKAAAKQKAQVSIAAVLAILLLGSLGYFFYNNLQKTSKEHALALKENGKLETAKRALDKSHASHDQAIRTYNLLVSGLGRSKPMIEIVKNLSDSIPKTSGVNLTSFTFERGNIMNIHGSAKTESAVTDLVLGMQAATVFKEVKLNYVGDAQADNGGPAAAGATPAASKKASVSTFLITCKVPGADEKLKSDLPVKSSGPGNNAKSKTGGSVQ